ncbi:MAG TPA: hypothetical protein VKP14_10180 [Gaiellaceae bacterium]|nr:hypothetical protein [Gaiellaceae bacterium]
MKVGAVELELDDSGRILGPNGPLELPGAPLCGVRHPDIVGIACTLLFHVEGPHRHSAITWDDAP